MPANPQNAGIRERSTDSLNGLLACPPMLLEFTFDPLRFQVAVGIDVGNEDAFIMAGAGWGGG